MVSGMFIKLPEIGQIWGEHYPNRHSDHVSRQMSMLVCSLVRQLARIEIGCGNPTMRLNKILESACIPIEQFEEYEEVGSQPQNNWEVG